MTRHIMLIAAAAALSPMALQAQPDSTAAVTELDLFGEQELVVTASRYSQPLSQAPATIEVITAEEIRQRGYIDLEQLFHDLPGFDISRGNGTSYSTIYQRGYRSNNTDRTILLLDGVEENDLWKGEAWISRQYPLTNIDRVEVVYGPASTMYGANAFVGVINVITKDAGDIIKPGRHTGLASQVGYGTWNTRYADITAAARYQQTSLSVTVRLFRSDEMDLSGYADWDYDLSGYDRAFYRRKLGTAIDSLADRARALDSAAYYNAAQTGGIRAGYSDNTDDRLVYAKLRIEDFTLGYQQWRSDEGYGAWYRDDYELGPRNGGRWVPANSFLYVKYEKQLGPVNISNLTSYKIHQLDGASQEGYFVGYLNGGLDLGDLTVATGPVQPYWDISWWYVLSKQLRSELKVHYNLSQQADIIAGLEYRNSLIQGDYIKSDQPYPSETGYPVDKAGTGLPGGAYFEQNDLGLYAQLDCQPVRNISFTAGGRVDHNRVRQHGGYGTVFNPRLALGYQPRRTILLKAIYAEAFKDADNWTKYSTVPARLLSNPTLPPERARNFELSFRWSAGRDLWIDLAGYQAWYSNVVGTATVILPDGTPTTQHQPVGSLRIRGVQARAIAKFQVYTLRANYTFTNPWCTSEQKRIGDIASHRANLEANACWRNRYNANVRGHYVGARKTGAGTTVSANPLGRIAPYFTCDASIGYLNLLPGLNLQLTVNNIFDKEYFDPGVRGANGDYYASRLPQPRRNLMLTAQWAW